MQLILESAGYEVHIGSLIEDLNEPMDIELPSGNTITLKPIVRENDRVGVDSFFPCAVLLNNDLSGGRPAILENVKQTLLPPLELGWANRYKTEHFAHYSDVTKAFSKIIDIDPWLITPMSIPCGPINFKDRTGLEDLAQAVNKVMEETQQYLSLIHI